MPLVERAELYDIRDKVYSTAASENPRDKGLEVLTVEAREGLSVGLAVTVRYRLDPAISTMFKQISRSQLTSKSSRRLSPAFFAIRVRVT